MIKNQILIVRDSSSDNRPQIVNLFNRLMQIVPDNERHLFQLAKPDELQDLHAAIVLVEPSASFLLNEIADHFPLTTKVAVCHPFAYATGNEEILLEQIEYLKHHSQRPPKSGGKTVKKTFLQKLLHASLG